MFHNKKVKITKLKDLMFHNKKEKIVHISLFCFNQGGK
tara:strand:- start:218 stop:331 length:114 start_codon:yes stop_codon:yes gene_type:complete